MQGALETLGIPLHRQRRDGLRARDGQVAHQARLARERHPDAALRVVDARTDWMRVVAELGLPLIVKPAREGSTIGITKVTSVDHDELALAYAEAARHDDLVLVEEFVAGTELTASILGDRALPLIRIEAPARQLRLSQQVFLRRHEVLLPVRASPEAKEREIRAASLAAFRHRRLHAAGAGSTSSCAPTARSRSSR